MVRRLIAASLLNMQLLRDFSGARSQSVLFAEHTHTQLLKQAVSSYRLPGAFEFRKNTQVNHCFEHKLYGNNRNDDGDESDS